MKLSISKDTKGIGALRRKVKYAEIQIILVKKGLLIDVEFTILDEDIPSIFSMKYMMQNGIAIYTQKKHLTFDDKKTRIKFNNYFLVHQWKQSSITFSFLTEMELVKTHRSFSYPSISAIEGFFAKMQRRIFE